MNDGTQLKKFFLDISPGVCYNAFCSKNMALWCSRLARQPVTLEVDGSSPFGVAKKQHHPLGGVVFYRFGRTRTIKMRQSGGLSPPTARRRRSSVFAMGENANESVRADQPCTTLWVVLFFIVSDGRERSNATVRGTVAADGSTEALQRVLDLFRENSCQIRHSMVYLLNSIPHSEERL